MKNGAMLRRYIGHDAAITAYCYCSDLKLLITGSSDNTVKFWDLNSEEEYPLQIFYDMLWPTDIRVEKYLKSDFYFIMCIDAHSILHLTFIDSSNNSIKFSNSYLKLDLSVSSNIEINDIISSYDRRLSSLRLFYSCIKKERNDNTNFYFLNPNKYFFYEWVFGITNGEIVVNENLFPNFKEFSFHRNNPHKMFKFDKELVRVDDLKLLTFGKR
jgi:WD40 repeat protein